MSATPTKKPTHIEIARELQSRFVGKTVTLLDDEPTGVGFYGEKGMMANITAIIPMNDDGYEYFEVKMDFASHRQHNIQFERPVWHGAMDKLGTATETGNVENTVSIGLEHDQIVSYIQETQPNPVYEAWQATGDGQSYTDWLEGIARAHLGIEDQPSVDDAPSP